MDIAEYVSLKSYNTFGIDVKARYMVTVTNAGEIVKLINSDVFKKNDFLILGGGSNILLTDDYQGLVIKNEIKGSEVLEEDGENVIIKIGAGEVWHDAVLNAVANGWGGIENMSLIPGTVGAAPMQNIGAYGIEIKDVFSSLEAIELRSGETVTFSKEQCQFGYRQSIFKNAFKNQYFISAVNLRLSKKPGVNISYGAIKQKLIDNGINDPTIKDVSDVVIAIRQSKLPDPAEIGNAGSFFKNPTITEIHFEELKERFSDIVGYENESGIKVPAGWLIEHAGWKGETFGNIGVHKNQALVLVNYGGGSGEEIWQLSEDIKQSVFSKYGIELEREVNII